MKRLIAITAIACAMVFCPTAAADSNPLAGQSFWVDHEWSVAWQDMLALQREGRDRDASLVHKIAEQPQFVWYGR